MIDNLSILLSHALLLYVFYHLMYRDDLDIEGPPPPLHDDDARDRFRPIKLGQKRTKPSEGDTAPSEVRPAPIPRHRRAPKPVGKRGDA